MSLFHRPLDFPQKGAATQLWVPVPRLLRELRLEPNEEQVRQISSFANPSKMLSRPGEENEDDEKEVEEDL